MAINVRLHQCYRTMIGVHLLQRKKSLFAGDIIETNEQKLITNHNHCIHKSMYIML